MLSLGSPPYREAIAPIPRISLHAFWARPETEHLFQQVADDPRMARVKFEHMAGGLARAIEVFQTTPASHLILVEAQMDREVVFPQLDALADLCDISTKVIILGETNDVQLYRDLMARGISDYLIAPVSAIDVVHAIAHLYKDPVQRLIGRVIALCGVKGGVGASSLAHNLATTIGRSTQQMTMIIDLDMAFGTAALNFNQEPTSTLLDALKAAERLDTMFIERLLVTCENYVTLLPAPALLADDNDVPNGSLNDLPTDLLDFILETARSLAHIIILDLPHGWPNWKRHLLLNADEVILVAEPDLAGLRNAKNILDFLQVERPQDLQSRFILNKTGMAKRPEISASDFEKALSLKPMALIPHQPKIFGMAENNGQPIADIEGSGKLREIFKSITYQIAGPVTLQHQRFSRFKNLLDELRHQFSSRIS